jgi:replication initiation and membrane attachment protein DnaB
MQYKVHLDLTRRIINILLKYSFIKTSVRVVRSYEDMLLITRNVNILKRA